MTDSEQKLAELLRPLSPEEMAEHVLDIDAVKEAFRRGREERERAEKTLRYKMPGHY